MIKRTWIQKRCTYNFLCLLAQALKKKKKMCYSEFWEKINIKLDGEKQTKNLSF